MLSPPKKKKLPLTSVFVSIYSREDTQQERNPGHVLDEGVDDITLSKAIFEQSESEVPRAGEDHCASQPNLKTVLIKSVDLRHGGSVGVRNADYVNLPRDPNQEQNS